MDDAWIKNLAQARVEDGKLVVPLDNRHASFFAQRIQDSMHQIYELAHRYAAAYNLYVEGAKTINCMTVSAEGDRGEGIVILLGRRQIRLTPCKGLFLAEGSSVEAFVRKGGFRWAFRPHTDACGTVVWSQDHQLLMDGELLVKKLFEALVQWEGEAIAARESMLRANPVIKESFYEN